MVVTTQCGANMVYKREIYTSRSVLFELSVFFFVCWIDEVNRFVAALVLGESGKPNVEPGI